MRARKIFKVRGIVQGVGFRPFVHRLASQLALSGFVRNESNGVTIEVEGEPSRLSEFLDQLSSSPPPLARISDVASKDASPQGGSAFRIDPSIREDSPGSSVPADITTCPDCLRQLSDVSDPRSNYPFINCTNCGPRFTIVSSLPYDRERTSLKTFEMCRRCRAEYGNPEDRRFHAEATCCPDCGPALSIWSPQMANTADPISDVALALLSGKIVALKGIGGFHLGCDAFNEAAVTELRRRKGRDEKPFALMAADVESVERLCRLSVVDKELLESAQRPIVLLERRENALLAASVAPGNALLGVMLPYTPLHSLLLKAVGRPLVMTSANIADEPIVFRDSASAQLRSMAHVILGHNRLIQSRCDDSVLRVIDRSPVFVRRSRGYAPEPVKLPSTGPGVLAVGGQWKNVFGLSRGGQAFLSHHVGDLDSYENFREYQSEIRHYEQLFGISPEILAHDLHPDYVSTRYALDRAQRDGLKLHAVQHHHAHMAACMADNGLTGQVIGVCFDGTGFGSDGAVWGGEFLTGNYRSFARAAHLRYVRLPGGDRAAQEPWRMAVSYLIEGGEAFARMKACVPTGKLQNVRRMIEMGLNSPLTSSVGRLFDAVSAVLGLRHVAAYDGQAAMELEMLARSSSADGAYPFAVNTEQPPIQIDTRPLFKAILRDLDQGVEKAAIARRFHSTLADMITETCRAIRIKTALNRVVLSGGVFVNAILTADAKAWLRAAGFSVYSHRQVPPNDGGLALGQLAVARAQEFLEN